MKEKNIRCPIEVIVLLLIKSCSDIRSFYFLSNAIAFNFATFNFRSFSILYYPFFSIIVSIYLIIFLATKKKHSMLVVAIGCLALLDLSQVIIYPSIHTLLFFVSSCSLLIFTFLCKQKRNNNEYIETTRWGTTLYFVPVILAIIPFLYNASLTDFSPHVWFDTPFINIFIASFLSRWMVNCTFEKERDNTFETGRNSTFDNSSETEHFAEKIVIKGEKSTVALSVIPVLIVLCVIALFAIIVNSFEFDDDTFNILCTIIVALIVALIITHLAISRCNLIVTDKRVYGIAIWGKRVDLPLDSISAVGTSLLMGIDVGSSAGKIHFKLVQNYMEIHKALGSLLIERQQTKKQEISSFAASSSNADELKKYKDLFDSGVITQEEFDAKKKQILDL